MGRWDMETGFLSRWDMGTGFLSRQLMEEQQGIHLREI